MMATVHVHSKYNLNRTQSVGVIDVPDHIYMSLNLSPVEDFVSRDVYRQLTNCVSRLSRGSYTVRYDGLKFDKVRGYFTIHGNALPIEIVFATFNKSRLPIIVRLADYGDDCCYSEYLVYSNIVMLRNYLFGKSADTISLFHSVAQIVAFRSCDDLHYLQAAALGDGYDFLTLIPNTSSDRLLMNSPISFDDTRDNYTLVEEFISKIFFPNAHAENILMLGGIVDGKIPYRTYDDYIPSGVSLHHNEINIFNSEGRICGSRTVLGSIHFIDKIRIFANMIYDGFELTVKFVDNTIEFNASNVISTSGRYVNPAIGENSFKTLCTSAMQLIEAFGSDRQSIRHEGLVYYLINGNSKERIDSVCILKTIDDEIRISIKLQTRVAVFDYDLIMLSVLTPSIFL